MSDNQKRILARPNLYDYLKIFAIVFMVVDHVGFFLFPELLSLRVIGRWSFPVFLFLVGFNGSYKWRWSLWIAALLVEIPMQTFMFHHTGGFGSMNILIGIGLCRLFLSFLSINFPMIKTTKASLLLLGWAGVFIVLHYLGLNSVLDYGGMVFLFGLLGYRFSTKNRENSIVPELNPHTRNVLMLMLSGFGVFAFHGWTQYQTFGGFFDGSDRLTVFFGWLILLTFFMILSQMNISLKTDYRLRDSFVLWFSRYALKIYVLHILLLIGLRFLIF